MGEQQTPLKTPVTIEGEKIMTYEDLLKNFNTDLMPKIHEAIKTETEKLAKVEPEKKAPLFPGAEKILAEEEMYKSFWKFICAVFHDRQPKSQQILKDMSIAVSAAGGYGVPTEFLPQIILKRAAKSVFRPNATTLQVGAKGEIPAEDGGITMYLPGENVAITESEMTDVLGQVTWATVVVAGLVKGSRQLFISENVGLARHIMYLFGKGFAAKEDTLCTTGTGSSQPKGITQETLSNGVSQGGATLDADDIIDCEFSLPAPYRTNAKFMMSNDMIAAIRKLKQDGKYVWERSIAPGTPSTLLNYPILENNNLGTTEFYFGDWELFYFFDQGKMAVESTDVGGDAFKAHQTWLKGFEYIDAKCAMTEAFTKLDSIVLP